MNDDIHTVTFRLLDGTTEDRQMTTAQLLDLNAAWLSPDSPDKPEDDEPEAALRDTRDGRQVARKWARVTEDAAGRERCASGAWESL